ncbi:MAG: hypothetical protein H0W78_06305 [Planctomycetes bacterium]|nr:hypothetical protein [Planctomycetota bacterium]
MRRLILSAVLAIGLTGALAPVAATAADMAVPAPMAMPEETAYVIAVVPDLLATLGRIEAIAGQFAPGQMPPGSLKGQLGAMLGDPGLANFTGKPVIVVVGPGAPTPSFALLVPATDPQKYLDAGVNFGMLLGKAVDGIAVLTQTPDGEILGEKVAKTYANLIKTLPKGDIRLLVAPDKLMQTYGGMLGMMAQMAAAQNPNGAGVAKILGLEVAGLMAIAADISAVQIDLNLDPVAIGEELTISAKPGSELAKALVAPPAAVGQRAAARLSNEPSLMAMSGRVNHEAYAKYAGNLLRMLKAKPEGQALITDEVIAVVEGYGAGLTGDTAMRMRTTEAQPLLWEGLSSTSDSAKAEANFEKLTTLFTGKGAIADLYREMGITMSLDKGVRTSPSGVPVHAMKVTIDETKVTPEQAAQMKAMSGYELAVTKGWVVMAQDPASLDALIAGTGKGMTTHAEKTLGAGRNLYADIDLIGLVRAAMKMSGTGMDAMIPATKPGEPMSIASTTADGRTLIEIKWPLAPFVELMKAAQGGGAPQPKPEDNPAF